MGLFSSIGKIFFDDPSDDIRKGTELDVAARREELDYLKEVQAPVLAARNEALPLISDFFTGGPEAQEQLIGTVRASPFYQSMIDEGEEAVLRNAAVTGGLRTGAANLNLARNSQNVLQNLVNQQLSGLGSLAQTPINTSQIGSAIRGIGQTQGQGIIAEANANQALGGQVFNAGLQGLKALFTGGV